MGKYRAQLSVPNHLFGTVKEYDDSDPVLQHRVASGMLVRVDEAASPEKPKKQLASQRRVKKASPKKVEAEPVADEVKPDPDPEPEPEPETEAVVEESVEEPKSSVQTSWSIGG
jgi:hypothetical protein